MIHRETPNFKASLYAPNPLEVAYWIDLKEGPDGQVIKTFDGKEWVRINDILNDEQTAEIEKLKERCTILEETKLDIDVFNEYVEEATEIHEHLEQTKADKATTLAGYGITDAYTKDETDQRINSAVADLVDQAPEMLDTLNELANALGDDPNFATTITNELANKQDELVAGVNLKTINGESLLGSGNIAIIGGEGGDIDLSNYATLIDLAQKQDLLVSGTNIKTVNGQSLLGNGNIEIEGGDVDLNNYYTKSEVDGKIPTVPTNVSAFTNDAGYITNAALSDINQNITNLQESVTNIEESVSNLDNYATDEELAQGLSSKQDTLVSGTNVKTINGQSILGSGNITIESPEGGITDAPADGNLYGRRDGSWSQVTIPDTSNFITETTADSKYQPKGTYLTSIPDEYVTDTELTAKNYATVSQIPDVSDFVTESEVNQKIASLVDSAPETLDTLNELAAALGDDPNFATTIATQIGQKQDTLVSGTTIKTINNESLLGSGNISVATSEQLTEGLANKLDITTYTSDKANFALKSEIPNVDEYLTEIEADGKYQPKGDYLTEATTKTINSKSIQGSGNLQLCEYESLSFSELKSKASAHQLTPGSSYFIEDYQCAYIEPVTDTERIETASNWQIVVRAISSDAIAIEASVVDKTTNKDLGYKLVWFSINKEDAVWTKTVSDDNFRGVILRLVDKYNNDFPYDFKHIRYARYAVTDIQINKTPGTADYVSAWRYLNPVGLETTVYISDERASIGAGNTSVSKEADLIDGALSGKFRHLWTGNRADLTDDYISEYWRIWESTTHPRNKYLAASTNLNTRFVNTGTDTNPLNFTVDAEDVAYFYTFDKDGQDASEMLTDEGNPAIHDVSSTSSNAFGFSPDYPLQNNVFNIYGNPYNSGHIFNVRMDSNCFSNTFIIGTYGAGTQYSYMYECSFDSMRYNIVMSQFWTQVYIKGTNNRNIFIGSYQSQVRMEQVSDNIICGEMFNCDLYRVNDNLFINVPYNGIYTDGGASIDGEVAYLTQYRNCYGNIFGPAQYSNFTGNHINSNTFADYYYKGINALGRTGYCYFGAPVRWGVTWDYNLLGLNTNYHIQRSYFGPGSITLYTEEHTDIHHLTFGAATSVFNNIVDNVYFVGYIIPQTTLAKAENRAGKATQLISNSGSIYLDAHSSLATKSELEDLATKSEIANMVSSTSVNSIQVVSSLPSVQEDGVLYLVTGE